MLLSFFRVLAKTKYLLKDYKGALVDLNRADRARPDSHVTLRCNSASNSKLWITPSLQAICCTYQNCIGTVTFRGYEEILTLINSYKPEVGPMCDINSWTPIVCNFEQGSRKCEAEVRELQGCLERS
jgi:hypothetical protein